MQSKPSVGETTTSDTTESSTTTTTATETSETDTTETETKTDTEDNSTATSTSQYVHPLDVPEDDSVIGKTVIVNGKAVVLSNNRDEKVYDGE
jgi:hypothetical protein